MPVDVPLTLICVPLKLKLTGVTQVFVSVVAAGGGGGGGGGVVPPSTGTVTGAAPSASSATVSSPGFGAPSLNVAAIFTEPSPASAFPMTWPLRSRLNDWPVSAGLAA